MLATQVEIIIGPLFTFPEKDYMNEELLSPIRPAAAAANIPQVSVNYRKTCIR